MAGETIQTLVGNLTNDPEMRFTPSGAGVANFTIASTPRSFDKTTNAWVDGETLFMRCNVWREQAENVTESLTKGMKVVAIGRLKSRTFDTKEGEKRTVIELEVDHVGPSLERAVAKVEKKSGNGGGQPQQARGGQQQGGWSGSGGQSPANAWGAPQGQQPASNGWGGR